MWQSRWQITPEKKKNEYLIFKPSIFFKVRLLLRPVSGRRRKDLDQIVFRSNCLLNGKIRRMVDDIIVTECQFMYLWPTTCSPFRDLFISICIHFFFENSSLIRPSKRYTSTIRTDKRPRPTTVSRIDQWT